MAVKKTLLPAELTKDIRKYLMGLSWDQLLFLEDGVKKETKDRFDRRKKICEHRWAYEPPNASSKFYWDAEHGTKSPAIVKCPDCAKIDIYSNNNQKHLKAYKKWKKNREE